LVPRKSFKKGLFSTPIMREGKTPIARWAVHPEKPFDFAEKAYWLQRDAALNAFVDQWLHIAAKDGSFRKIYAAWFE
jgi:ABC-type amino acid transport substrate-binding protein